MTSITIVTCWLAHPELAEDYVAAIGWGSDLHVDDEVIIVDNGGAPSLPFTIATPSGNMGFALGSNLGLELAKAEAVLFLNNDVALGRRGWLQEIREALEPGVLVGPWRNDFHAAVDGQAMPYLDGWCLAGLRADLEALGGFDDQLLEPAYYSDNLLCLEARAAGMTLREVKVGLRHKLNVTAGSSASAAVQRASAANRDRYLARARELLVAA